MKKIWIAIFTLGMMFFGLQTAWATHKPRISSCNHKMHPPKDKPFEGEWRTCRKHKKTGKLVCASHFFLQQGKQVCGTWQEANIYNSKNYSGFLQAHMEPEEFRGQEGADYMAQVDFACSKAGDSILFFDRPICGNDAKEVTWQRLENGDPSVTTYLATGICRNRQTLGLIDGINQYAFCDYTVFDYLHKYRPMKPQKKKELLQLPWVQQCLSGQKPANIAPSN